MRIDLDLYVITTREPIEVEESVQLIKNAKHVIYYINNIPTLNNKITKTYKNCQIF